MSLSKMCLLSFGRERACSGLARRCALVADFYGRRFASAQPSLKNVPEKRADWNKVVNEAEKIVGYTTSYMSLRWLLSDEVSNVAMHMRKLVGSNHPLLKAAKGLVFNGRNNMQTWGLIVLLLSKSLGYSQQNLVDDEDKAAGFLRTQRALAEVTEMIRTSHLIHKGLMNLKKENINNDMIYGNKIALLSGDYLLSNSCMELANLQNQELVELMSSAVRDLSESEFLGPRDSQNNALPCPPQKRDRFVFNLTNDPLEPLRIEDVLGNAEAEWTIRTILEGGNLLGKSCQGTLKLAGHSESIQKEAFLFGRHFALAWQACLDRQPFFNEAPFSLTSAPVLFAIQNDPELYEEIVKGTRDVNEVDYGKIRKFVIEGPGLELTKKLQRQHSDIVYAFLEKLPISDSTTALENIIAAME